ncbi:hypothetical protein TNCV_2913051 [Trichonephila clavipes]|nr:hypothetical protein TNCV_2913051 [Trichonephila clavipes]
MHILLKSQHKGNVLYADVTDKLPNGLLALLLTTAMRQNGSSRWCGVIVRRGVPAQASSSSLDHDSKLRGPSPKALV